LNKELKIRCRIANKIIRDASKSNWNTWREHYDNLSINDLIWINLAINEFIRDQICGTGYLIESSIKTILSERKELDVIELGCYRGYLAKDMMETFKDEIKSWVGYDINYYALENTVVEDSRYSTIKQTDWFYKIEFNPDANVFISTSTLEHHNANQFVKIIERIKESNIQYMILGFPLCDSRKWNDYGGSHVLDFTKEDVDEIIEVNNFECINYEKGRVHTWLAKRK
jgi:hypothetical protein